MKNSIFTRYLSILLAASLLLSNVAPALTFAAETESADSIASVTEAATEAAEQTTAVDVIAAAETTEAAGETTEAVVEDTTEAATEESEQATTEASQETTEAAAETTEAATETTGEAVVIDDGTEATESTEETTEATEETEELYVDDYDTFVANLKILEGYAEDYVEVNLKEDATELVINYIRTGVQRYTEGLWNTIAGSEKTAFVEYVAQQDELNGTQVGALRNLRVMVVPNGQELEFEHMFGTLNMAYVTNSVQTDDLGGWGGDICDLMQFSKGKASGDDIEALTKDIYENYLGAEGDGAFGWEDIYGDLDAFYLDKKLGEYGKLSPIFRDYFTEDLTDKDRAEFFLHNRFSGLLTREDVRYAVYDAYSGNPGISLLEGDRDLKSDSELRTACCYAFADYLYDLAGDTLTGEVEETTAPTEDTVPDESGGDTIPDETVETEPTNPYYSVFSSTDSVIAPGIAQTIHYALTADEKQIVYYVATVDVGRDDVSIHANYKNNDGSTWGMARVVDQMAAAQEKHSDPENYPEYYVENYNAVLGVNADFFNMSTGKPSGALVMEGVKYNGVGSENFFAILDDGTPILGSPSEWSTYESRVVEAVGGSSFLVKNGQIVVSATTGYYSDRASRTCVGITEDNQVVLMVLDGRQEPFSAGGALIELAQIMLDAGCVTAINLDGGGSTTFAAKAEGSDTVSVINRPSDGFARSVSSSLVVVSTAKISYEFDHALIETDYDYVTVGTGLPLTAIGVSSSGNNADVPENARWELSDSTKGTIENGVFTPAAAGEVEVRLTVDGVTVGSKVLQVVTPDGLKFEVDSLNAIYGVPVELPLTATYNGNPVAFTVGSDVMVGVVDAEGGTIDGLTFTGIEASGLRKVQIGARLNANYSITAAMVVNLYREDEAVFDFDAATGGDRVLAWNREVTNSELEAGDVHHIIDPAGAMDLSYVFALDMESIEIPEKLQELVFMLPGGDVQGATAWDFLLQLAERVSVLTEVKVVAQFDMDLDVDVSGLKISNDFFALHSAELDEATNTLTVIAKWIDRDAAVDPAAANPICILSGIKATVKDGAQWEEDKLDIVNGGKVTYDVYLRANALYSNAVDPAFQEEYQLYPFENEDVIIGGTTEKGAHYAAEYTSFTDDFILDRTNRNGWYQVGDFPTYYENNKPVSGVKKVPCYEDQTKEFIYEFNEDGTIAYAFTGIVALEDGIYNAVNGELKTGWQTTTGPDGNLQYYFFNTWSKKAVTGKQTINGYQYEFEDYVLVRGELVTDSRGTRYMWAGSWLTQAWVDIDGNISYCLQNGYFATGLQKRYSPEGDYLYYAFDENGIWMKDFSGMYEWNGGTYLILEGYVIEYPGLFEWEGDLYYIASTNVLVKGCNYWISKTNGLLPEGSYTFADDGRLIMKGSKFNVTWVNEDGTVLEEDKSVTAGEMPVYNGATPTKAADAQYTYTFADWTPRVKVLTKDTVFTATYTATVNKYTVTFRNADGTVLQTGEVEYGTVPAYTGAEPAKAADAQYTYTFAGWDKQIEAVTGEVTYTATYTQTIRTYTIIFRNDDGNVLQESQLEYGATPRFGGTPAKAADAQYTYTFAGWDKEIETVSEDAVYTAIYSKKVNQYTVTFRNENGAVLQQLNAYYGEVPVYTGTTPTKAADAQYTYTFSGWTPEVTVVTGDATYTAVFSETAKTYTITFKNYDGTVLQETDVAYGEVPVYSGEMPEREGTARYSYTFSGWDPELAAVTGNATYTAVFTSTVNKYTVTFVNYDGAVLQESRLEYGEIPAYSGETPVRAADAQYTYTFNSWDKGLLPVSGDVVYTAVYKTTVNTYTIIWADEDGTVLETDNSVAYGAAPRYDGAVPTKAGDAQYTHEFAGWSPEVATVTGNVTYTAVYNTTVNEYPISWDTNGDGKVDDTTMVPYGQMPEHEDGEKPNEGKVGYVFAGWTPELTAVTGAATYTATFTEDAEQFTITFQNEDGTVLQRVRVTIGTVPVFKGTPVKEADAQYTYTFKAWDREIVAASEDTTYTASYTRALRTYVITFEDHEGTVLKRNKLTYGSMPVAPTNNPQKSADEFHTYAFAGWQPEIAAVAGDVTYTPVYDTTHSLVTFQDEDGTVLQSGKVQTGTIPAYTGETPVKAKDDTYSYAFTGWTPEIAEVSDVAVYTAVYAASPLRNGIVEEDGKLYWYVNDDRTYAGLIRIDGAYYYAKANGELVVGRSYWITRTNGLLAEGSYEFDAEGKLILPEAEPDVPAKNGIVAENGSLFYYVDGELYYAGLIQVDGAYYYVRTSGELVWGRSYWITKTNGLLPEQSYTFAEDGRIILNGTGDVDTAKNGIVAEEDGLYYYVNGVRTYAGLIVVEGDYCYVKTSGQLVTGGSYWITKTNGLMAEGSYRFDEGGRMIDPPAVDVSKDGIVAENGSLFYYENGVLTYAGLIEIDGDYYYVKTSGEVVHGRTYWITKTNGLMEEKSYAFAADGRMLLEETGDGEKNGIEEENGSLYYYVDGELTYAGLIEINGKYYYVKTTGELVVGRKYWTAKTNGLMAEGLYTFGADGAMVR